MIQTTKYRRHRVIRVVSILAAAVASLFTGCRVANSDPRASAGSQTSAASSTPQPEVANVSQAVENPSAPADPLLVRRDAINGYAVELWDTPAGVPVCERLTVRVTGPEESAFVQPSRRRYSGAVMTMKERRAGRGIWSALFVTLVVGTGCPVCGGQALPT
jgi:hypothetical protein